ncbi:MAG: MipA/OmpV family protein [Cohaesibacter sp.]|nr:MipA/OmpV family protein [Cohaesibacter sp.]
MAPSFACQALIPRAILPIALGAVFLLSPSSSAKADSLFTTLMQGGLTEADNWKVSLGGGLLYNPRYEGSKRHSVKALPYFDLVWKDTLFFNPIDGLGANLLKYQGFKAGAALGYDFGRKEKNSRSELQGLGDIDAGGTARGFLEYDLKLAKAKASLTKYLAGSKGVTTQIGLSTFVPLSVLLGQNMGEAYATSQAKGETKGHGLPGAALTLGLSAQWADKAYMREHFGINAAQAAGSGKKTFEAKAGFKSFSTDLGLLVPLTDHVIIGSKVSYTRLIGDAADSPLSLDDNQLGGQLFASYTF